MPSVYKAYLLTFLSLLTVGLASGTLFAPESAADDADTKSSGSEVTLPINFRGMTDEMGVQSNKSGKQALEVKETPNNQQPSESGSAAAPNTDSKTDDIYDVDDKIELGAKRAGEAAKTAETKSVTPAAKVETPQAPKKVPLPPLKKVFGPSAVTQDGASKTSPPEAITANAVAPVPEKAPKKAPQKAPMKTPEQTSVKEAETAPIVLPWAAKSGATPEASTDTAGVQEAPPQPAVPVPARKPAPAKEPVETAVATPKQAEAASPTGDAATKAGENVQSSYSPAPAFLTVDLSKAGNADAAKEEKPQAAEPSEEKIHKLSLSMITPGKSMDELATRKPAASQPAKSNTVATTAVADSATRETPLPPDEEPSVTLTIGPPPLRVLIATGPSEATTKKSDRGDIKSTADPARAQPAKIAKLETVETPVKPKSPTISLSGLQEMKNKSAKPVAPTLVQDPLNGPGAFAAKEQETGDLTQQATDFAMSLNTASIPNTPEPAHAEPETPKADTKASSLAKESAEPSPPVATRQSRAMLRKVAKETETPKSSLAVQSVSKTSKNGKLATVGLAEVRFTKTNGEKKVLLSDKIWRIRKTASSTEPAKAWVIYHAGGKFYAKDENGKLMERVSNAVRLDEFTAPNGDPVFIAPSMVDRVLDAVGGKHHPKARSLIVTKWGSQQVQEAALTVNKRVKLAILERQSR